MILDALTFLINVLAASALVAPAGNASAEGARLGLDGGPYLADGTVEVAYNVQSCGTRKLRFYEREYRTAQLSGGREFDLAVIGVFDPDPPWHHGPPLVWLYFGQRMEVIDVFITMPGRPVERLTNAALTRRWPHACDMIEDLSRAAGRDD